MPAVAIMSNRISDRQVEKINRWAREFANGRVNLLFDNDQPGLDGAKDALWQFAQKGLNVQLLWSRATPMTTHPTVEPEKLAAETIMGWFSSRE